MQSTSGQVEILEIEPRTDQINYIKDHWYIEGLEKMVKGSGLSAQQVYYTAFTILKLKPRKIGLGPRGTRGYKTLDEIHYLNVIGKPAASHTRLPKIVLQSLGYVWKEKIPVVVKDDNKRISITLFKKGTPPPFLGDNCIV